MWISQELQPAVRIFEMVRYTLADLYEEIERTFPDCHSRLSEAADQRNTQEAFPGGPTRQIYEPIKDTLLIGKAVYDNNIKLESFKVSSEEDSDGLKKGKRRLTAGERAGDDGAVEDPKGKKRAFGTFRGSVKK